MALFTTEKFKCARCGQKNAPMGFAPVPTELGKKIGQEVCADCWQEWLKKQKQLINHFGLDVSNPETHEFLFDQMKIFFYEEDAGSKQIDETRQGTVEW